MTDEEKLRQALRRLRDNVYLYASAPKRISPAKYEDLITVKLAYMAEHPDDDDDDEPLTDEWLMQVQHNQAADLMGNVYSEYGIHFHRRDGGIKEPVLRRFVNELGHVRWSLCGDVGNSSVGLDKEPETRGDLRRLCVTLGIEIDETPPEKSGS